MKCYNIIILISCLRTIKLASYYIFVSYFEIQFYLIKWLVFGFLCSSNMSIKYAREMLENVIKNLIQYQKFQFLCELIKILILLGSRSPTKWIKKLPQSGLDAAHYYLLRFKLAQTIKNVLSSHRRRISSRHWKFMQWKFQC